MTPTTDANREKLLRLRAPSLLLGLRSLGVKLSPNSGQLDIDTPNGVLTGELLELLKVRKADLLDAIKSEPERRQKPPVVGQSMEELIASIDWAKLPGPKPDPEADIPREELPPTWKQLEVLRRGQCFDIPKTRGAASDRIKELIESGALCDFLSLAELEAFDRRAPGRNRRQRRFCCCLCGDNKPMDASHRSLNADMTTGLYYCHRCGARGKLREYLGAAGLTRTFTYTGPMIEKANENWRRHLAFAVAIRDTDGAAYLRRRGVPVDVAERAGVKFGAWWREGEGRAEPFDAVIFPVTDAGGNIVAAQARAINDDTKRTGGDKSLGVFITTPGARAARIAITEAPIDALVLAACGLPSIALLGTTWAQWLPGALAGRGVALATDADEAGDDCARKLGALLTAWRLRPVGAKDWAELAARDGLEAVRKQIDAAEIQLTEAAWGNAA